MTRATRADRISALASAAVVAVSAITLARRSRERQRQIAGLGPRPLPRRPAISLAPEPTSEVSLAPEPTLEISLAPEPATVPEPSEVESTAPDLSETTDSTQAPEPVAAPAVAPEPKPVIRPRAAKKATPTPARKAPAKSAAKAPTKAAAAQRTATTAKPKPAASTKPVRASAAAPAAKRVRTATPVAASTAKRATTSAAAKPRTAPRPKATAAATSAAAPTARLTSTAPHPVIRSVERRRTEPIPGRRARRPHLPKRRRERRAGLLPAVVMLIAGLALAVPWYRPGFGAEMSRWGNAIDHWSTSAGQAIGQWIHPPAPAPVVIQDPQILDSEPAAPSAHAAPVKGGVPQILTVPLLQVISQVVPISGNSGVLLPPDNPQLIGWWEQGPKPGSSQGTAVLTGHTVHLGGGAFDHLALLKVGNHFSIQTDHGTIRYVVAHMRKYETGTLAQDSSSLFRLTGPPRVLLVTCSGWNGHIYLDNTVVTGVPVT